jgi:hypothetical protein
MSMMEGCYPDARRNSVAIRVKIIKKHFWDNIMLSRYFWTILSSLLTLCIGTFAMAEDSQVLKGSTILTISVGLEREDGGDTFVFDRAALSALPATNFETSTVWTNGVSSFTGVSLQNLALELGVNDGWFLATAINDYTVKIPLSDAVEGGPIIAYLKDGDEMSIRDKGPLWVIYPYDLNIDYRSEVIFSRSIWQLNRLEILQ